MKKQNKAPCAAQCADDMMSAFGIEVKVSFDGKFEKVSGVVISTAVKALTEECLRKLQARFDAEASNETKTKTKKQGK